MLGEYIGAGSGTTKLLLHLNGNSTDSSGNSNNGTDTDITYAPGRFGQCAGFNGTSSQIITNSAINLSPYCTIVTWIKTTATSGEAIIGTDIGATYAGLILQLQATTGKIILHDNAGPAVTGSISVNDGKWHLVAVTADANTPIQKIYIDGNLDTTGNATFSYQNVKKYIGRYYSYNTIGMFTGSIDETFIILGIWSAAKIAKYYSFAKGRFGII